jgi:NitT/TauT family transport system substrate-binding protein
MIRKLLFVMGLILALILTACGSPASTSSIGSATTSTTSTQPVSSTVKPSTSSSTSLPSSTTTKPPVTPVKVAIGGAGVSLISFTLVVAEVKGFWKAEGVEVESVNITDAAAPAALIQGDLKFHVGSLTSSFAYAPQIKAVSGQGVKRVLNKLIVRSGINTIQDLKGKQLAITSFGSTSHAYFLFVLKKAGIDPSEVTFIPSPNSAAWVAGMKAGTFDAAVPSIPGNYELLDSLPGSKVLVDLGDYFPESVNTCLMTTSGYIEKNPAIVKQVVTAFTKAIEWQIDPKNADELATLYATTTKSPLDLAKKSVKDVPLALGHLVTENGFNTALDAQKLAGSTAKLATYNDVVDMTIQKVVMQELGLK